MLVDIILIYHWIAIDSYFLFVTIKKRIEQPFYSPYTKEPHKNDKIQWRTSFWETSWLNNCIWKYKCFPYQSDYSCNQILIDWLFILLNIQVILQWSTRKQWKYSKSGWPTCFSCRQNWRDKVDSPNCKIMMEKTGWLADE